MKKLKKIIFTMIFASVISVIGILKVSAFCTFSNLPVFAYPSGSYGCVTSSGFGVSNPPSGNPVPVSTIISATGGGWERTISKFLVNPSSGNQFYFYGGEPACNFVPGGTSCSNGYSNYDFSSYPVNSSSIAYNSQPISIELAPGYVGSNVTNSRMTNYTFEFNLGKTYSEGNYKFEFYFAIGYITDSDWQDWNRVTNAFNFNNNTLLNYFVSSNRRGWGDSNSTNNTGFDPAVLDRHALTTINSVTTTWYGFPSATIPYFILGTKSDNLTTSGNWYVAKVVIDFDVSQNFQYFAFEYNGSNTAYWATGRSFYENLLFVGGSIYSSMFDNYYNTDMTFTAASGYSNLFSGLPTNGRLFFNKKCTGADGSVIDFPDINGGVYLFDSSSSAVFEPGKFKLLPYKYYYDENSTSEPAWYYVNYDFTGTNYDSLMFISSGKADRILSGTDTNSTVYYCEDYSSSILKKTCKIGTKLPFINKLFNSVSSDTYYKRDFPTDYICSVYVPNNNFYSDSLLYNSNLDEYRAAFKDSQGNFVSIESTGAILGNDLTGTFKNSKSLISPTLGIISNDLNIITTNFTTGQDSQVYVLIFSFLCVILTLLILKAGVKH